MNRFQLNILLVTLYCSFSYSHLELKTDGTVFKKCNEQLVTVQDQQFNRSTCVQFDDNTLSILKSIYPLLNEERLDEEVPIINLISSVPSYNMIPQYIINQILGILLFNVSNQQQLIKSSLYFRDAYIQSHGRIADISINYITSLFAIQEKKSAFDILITAIQTFPKRYIIIFI